MRRLFLVPLAAALLAGAASAATVDPQSLVLRKADLPRGFQVDRGQTGVRTNELEARDYPELRAKLVRWGRVTGYQAEFDRGSATISSRADVFRTAGGARLLLSFFDTEVRSGGVLVLRRAPTDVGVDGSVYSASAPVAFTLVVWRHGRVFAGVMGQGVTQERTIALARVQQRRIAAALR